MRRIVLLLGLTMAGCLPAALQERVHDYNQDGLWLYQRGDYRSAGESFQAALALQPEDAGLLYNVGQCYDHLGQGDRAEHFYQECLRRSTNHAACRHALAALWVREGRWNEAVRMVEEWLAREPKLAAPYAEDGWLWHQVGDLPRAQARLQQALQLGSNDVRALNELALVYEELQRPDRAADLYQRSLDREANQPDVARRLDQLRALGVSFPRPD